MKKMSKIKGNISGSATAINFGRGGSRKKYVEENQPNISASATAVSFGRGGSRKKYVQEE